MAPEHDMNRLAAFADQRLGDAERRATLEHLAGCSECRSVLASLARGGAIRAKPGSWRVPAGWLSLAAAVVIAVAAGTYLLAPGTPVRPESQAPAASQPAAAPAAPAAPDAGTPSEAKPSDVLRGPETRSAGGHDFRLVAGEWVDTAYDPADVLPVVAITTPAERSRALAAHPALAPFFALGPRVTVVLDGTVYRTDLR